MTRRKKGIPLNGWLNIDKPKGMTSTQVIGRVRRMTNAQKLGHAGTLDPLATGVLPIALGEATKTISFAQDSDKVYRFTIQWGEERDTDDAEGAITQTSPHRPSLDQIQALIPQFVGNIEQTPPKFSAIKIEGQRAYALARAGEDVEMKPRTVTVYALKIINVSPSPHAQRAGEGRGEGGGNTGAQLQSLELPSSPPHPNTLPPLALRAGEKGCGTTEFEMECGKGTYVRSLARDMGRILGCFGYISVLRRAAVGVFSEEDAIPLDALEKMMQSATPDRCLLPVETVLDDIPVLAMTEQEVSRIKQGQSIKLISRQDADRLSVAGVDEGADMVLAVYDSKPVALLGRRGVELHPVRLFNL